MDIVQFQQFVNENWPLVLLFMIWTLVWTGIALWKAAKLGHRVWFVVLLVANTLGILELFYIFFIAKPREEAREE